MQTCRAEKICGNISNVQYKRSIWYSILCLKFWFGAFLTKAWPEDFYLHNGPKSLDIVVSLESNEKDNQLTGLCQEVAM
jgi:hypothetical protein